MRGYIGALRQMDSTVDYFPAFLRIAGKRCLLVGGGEVAARKARLLLDAGANITIVSPETVAAVDELIERGRHDRRVCHKKRRFKCADVDGHWLVISATNNARVEREVAAAADRQRVFCNAVDDLDNCSYITPAVVDRHPVIVAVSSAGHAPVLARKIRAHVEAILPARLGVLAALAGEFRQAVRKRFKDFRWRRRFWEQMFGGPAATHVFAGRDEQARQTIAALFAANARNEIRQGEAWLVGAGPGDPGLLTLNALQALQQADVVMHDRLVSDDILKLARRDARIISVGKSPGCTANSQDEISALLLELVQDGNRVCRLKGGDPFIFGRGGEEVEALSAAGLAWQVVPGITAAAGCAAAAGIPLTHRDVAQSVVLVTAHGKNSVDNLDWASLARDRQTLAVYMGVRRFSELMRQLIKHGRRADTPVAIIENGTRPEQRVIRGTLGQLPMLASAHRIKAPSVLIIGSVARQARVTQKSQRAAIDGRGFAREAINF